MGRGSFIGDSGEVTSQLSSHGDFSVRILRTVTTTSFPLSGSLIAVPELRTNGKTWIFQGDPKDRSKLKEGFLSYVKCHALEVPSGKIVEHDCSDKLVSICEVPRATVCNASFEHYYNGACYKVSTRGGVRIKYDTG